MKWLLQRVLDAVVWLLLALAIGSAYFAIGLGLAWLFERWW